jgi:outer membrane immunogenic protein
LGSISGSHQGQRLIGYTWDRALIYIKGGAAWVDRDLFIDDDSGFVVATDSDKRWGWMAGAGVEWALWTNWLAKIEYNYLDFGTARTAYTFVAFSPGNPCCETYLDQHMHIVKVGLNYRFGGAAPVVARY